MATFISYNVNGIRAALNKDLMAWLKSSNADVVCLQETKANVDQIDPEVFKDAGYHYYFHSAERKGYSGVAVLSKKEPKNVVKGIGIDRYTVEGRVLRLDFEEVSVLSCYFPNGGSGEERHHYKMDFLEDFTQHINNLKQEIPNLLIMGDINICHEEIDIHNPVSNKNTSGFLPEEREWFTKFLNTGLIDSFRHLNKEPDHYTWWSYRFNARKRNLGWRLDYGIITDVLESKLNRSVILSEAVHSDHCPILVDLNVKL